MQSDPFRGHYFHRHVPHRTMRPAPGDSAQPVGGQCGSAYGDSLLKRLIIVVVAGLLAWMLAGRLLSGLPATRSAPTIEQLQPLAGLITHRIVVVDALTITIAGYTGDLRAAVIVRGDAVITVDLSSGRIEQVNHDRRTAVIVLPPPHVTSARVDHDHTRIFGVEATGLWAVLPGDDGRAEIIDQAMRLAQHAIVKAANEPLVMNQARARAEALICAFFKDSLQWSVAVHWLDSEQPHKKSEAADAQPTTKASRAVATSKD